MSFLQRFYSAFPGGTMNLSPGGGTLTEVGGVLTASVSLGVDGDWANNVAPIAWSAVHDKHYAFDTVFKFEARMYSFTSSGGEARGGIAVYKDQDNGHEFGHYAGDSRIYTTRWYAGGGGNTANTGVLATPTVSPHAYRVYWNPTSRPLFVSDGELEFTINPNNLQFYYRVGDAGTWTGLLTYGWEWTPYDIHFGLCAHNYVATKRSVSALFSYAGIYQWDATKQIFVPANDQVPLTNTSVDPKVVASLEDQAAVLTQSGPAGHQWPDGQGDGLAVRETAVALEDQAQVLPQGGKAIHTMWSGLDQGLDVRPPAAGLEDQVSYVLSLEPEFSTITQDSDAHYHFVYPKPYLAIYHDTTNDPWNTPTLNNFTGYARDGYKYTNGVQDAGPVAAPWRSEASGANRSSRPDFPLKSLIVVTRLELVIFDLDTFTGSVPSLRVWMRFLLGNDVSTFYALGRGVETIRSVVMANGQLVVGTTNTGWEVGRVHSIDFKALTPATVYSLVGSDNQWVGQGTKSIVDRNTNSIWAVSGSVRLSCEENHSLAALVEGTNTLYIAVSGEDVAPDLLTYVGGSLQSVTRAAGDDIGGYDVGNYRQVLFDDVGWLWFSIGSVLYRNCRDWREGYMHPNRKDLRQGQVDLGVTITHLVAAKESIYAGTANGVYRIHKGSMEAYLAYTAPGGGGRGRLNVAASGELLAGGRSVIQALAAYTLLRGTTVVPYLSVGTQFAGSVVGGYTLLRLWDDVVVKSYVAPTIIEPGTYISPALLA